MPSPQIEKIRPMLAQLGTKADLQRPGWYFEPKMDGTRAILYNIENAVRLLNRRMTWVEYRYPELYGVWKNIKAEAAVLDCELVILDPKTGRPNFYLLAQREHQENPLKIEVLSKQIPATLIVFDVLRHEDLSTTSLTLQERKMILEQIIIESPRIKKCFYTEKGPELWAAIKKQGIEGVIGKRVDSDYQQGKRSKDWLKIKALKTLDVVIGGYTTGEGGRGTFGALLCGVYHEGQLRYLGRVGTGWDERQLVEFSKVLKQLEAKKNPFQVFAEDPAVVRKAHWVKPQLVAEVKFMNITPDLKMRAPSFKYFRVDKPAEDCAVTTEDIKTLKIR